MGNVMYFTLPYNKQKMEALQLTFEDQLREAISMHGCLDKISPELVARIIRSWYLERSGHSEKLAFPVIHLAKDLDIQVIVTDFSDTARESGSESENIKGYLGLYPEHANIPPRIVVSDTESYGHQRWTVAHELWHYLMHAMDHRTEADYYPEDSSNYDLADASEEANANKFATELLMPERIFRVVYKETSVWWRKEKLAKMFLVSRKAIKRRIRELNL